MARVRRTSSLPARLSRGEARRRVQRGRQGALAAGKHARGAGCRRGPGRGPTMKLPRAEVLRVLRKAGLPHLADELGPELPEIVDVDRERPLLDRHGVNLDMLINTMGGSP